MRRNREIAGVQDARPALDGVSRDMGIRFSMKLKVVLFIALLLVPLAGYAVYHYFEMVEHDTWHTRLLNREVTADGARMFDDIVDNTLALLRGIARHPSVISQDGPKSSRLLSEMHRAEPQVLTILAIDREGRVFSSATAGAMNVANSSWFRDALKRPTIGQYELLPLTRVPTIIVAMPVMDSRGQAAGVVAAPLNLDHLGRAVIRGLLLQDRAFLQIVDNNGAVVIDTSGRAAGKMVQYPVAAADGFIAEDTEGNRELITTMPMMYGGFRSAVGIPLEEAYRDARLFGTRFLLAFLALGGAVVFAGLLFARRLGKRTDDIIAGIREMELGNLDARLNPEGSDELRYVAERFNAMADARKQAEEERILLISELQVHIEKLSRAKKEWQATFDAITDPVSIHDREFRVIRANRAFSEHVGLEPQSVINKKCYEMMHHSCGPIKNCPHTATLQGVMSCSREVLDPRTNRTFQITTFPYHGDSGDFLGSVHIAKDITEQKDRDHRLAMTERFAALGRMASGIAHEINNPLAAISGCAEGLLNRVDRNTIDTEMFRRYLSIIQEEVFRCKSITSSMLSFTRKESFERKYLDLRDVIRKAIDLIGFQGRLKNTEIIEDLGGDLPLILGSEGELRQVFLTLLTNALDAMDEQGTLTVTAGSTGGNLRVTVRDTGPGIAVEHLDRLFEPFFTTKADRGGNGLGLSIANRIVANHQGTLSVASRPGEGAEFTLALPVPSQEREELNG